MPAASRQGDSLSTGHLCDTTTTLTTPGQSRVWINYKLAARKGDSTVSHMLPPVDDCTPHTAIVNVGSSTVYIHGSPAARIGDSTDAGSMTGGSADVFIGGTATLPDPE